ncbi:MAG: hypothetical protein CM15mP126_1090 [Gammaproteobacteria bacterium]|nr:MAG: hypothetical protein CM15mP126_1090 [Gammaproteobacteria bacterium]
MHQDMKIQNSELHQSKCMEMLKNLEKLFLKVIGFWEDISKLDISILPFIRQFRIANPEWFDSQEGIEKLQNVLNNFLESKLFKI